MSKKYGPPSPGDEVARLLRRRGVNLDPQRLDERLAAERSREKRDFAEYRDQVETLAFAAKRCRRSAALAESWWRQHPGSNTLADAQAAQQAKRAAVEALREICLDDEQMISDVYRKYGR
jgi:hypothetical protein